MKITNIENKDGIFLVTRSPNFIKRLLGFKPKTEKFKDTGHAYETSGARAYINEHGEVLGCFNETNKAIENFRRSF